MIRLKSNKALISIFMSAFFLLALNSSSLSQITTKEDHRASMKESHPAMNSLPVYEEAANKDKYLWIPSGWMPDGSGIAFQNNFKENCHGGETCIKLGYDSEKNSWVGMYWLANGSWKGPGINIYEELRVKKGSVIVLTFWARGEEGGEKAQFKVGGVSDGNDSIEFPVETEWIRLDKNWKQYAIDLAKKDLSNVVGGFCWVTKKSENPGKKIIRIFLDDIRYELR